MKFLLAFAGFAAILAVSSAGVASLIPATTLIRSPQHDSAIVHSERVGGNFAYSTLEGHAYQAISPIIHTNYRPLEIRYAYNEIPLGLPATSHFILGQQPIFSPLTPAIEVATDAARPADSKPIETEGTKIDDDTISVESA